jgi:hypothetical protein
MKKTFFLAGIASFLFTLAINAQDTTSSKPVQSQTTQDTTVNPAQTQTQTQNQNQATNQEQKLNSEQQTTQEQKKYGNPTVDSILSKYTLVPMPSEITTEQIFPVIGQYQSSANSSDKITVTLDDQNKGLVWIDGLPQGKIKAVERKSPATYKIPVQKTEDGKDVREGTMIYDKDTKVISLVLGRPYNDEDPASVFATTSATTTNDQTQSMSNDQTATNDQAKANDQSNMKVTKHETTKHGKTKTKAVEKKEEPPFVFTGTKVEQVTSMNK